MMNHNKIQQQIDGLRPSIKHVHIDSTKIQWSTTIMALWYLHSFNIVMAMIFCEIRHLVAGFIKRPTFVEGLIIVKTRSNNMTQTLVEGRIILLNLYPDHSGY